MGGAERRAHCISHAQVAQEHFTELAVSNGATTAEMRECEVVRDALPHAPSVCEVLCVRGTQLLADHVHVGLSIAIIRLREQRTDLLLSISRAGKASVAVQPHEH